MVLELDTAPYCDLPIPETSIVGLHAAAQAWGIGVEDPDRAQVLELGCAHGVNLLAMAARHPHARFVGVDLDAEAIAVAVGRAQRSGLSNARFVAADYASFPADANAFDYVIAHGVFSWVDEPHRDALLALVAHALTATGVGYVSYNAMPGGSMRLAVGDALRGAADGAADAREATLRMRRVLQQLRSRPMAGVGPDQLLQRELATLEAQPDAYLQHEFLGRHHTAWGVAAFCEAASKHGLQYLDDLAGVQLPKADLEELQDACEDIATGRVHAQTLIDAAVFRTFRATLLVREDLRLASSKRTVLPQIFSAEVPMHPKVGAYTRVEAEELGFVTTGIHCARALHPLHAALIGACDGTRDLDALVAFVLAKIEAGEVVLHNEAGEAALPEEVATGLSMVVSEALEQLAGGGLFVA